MIVKEGVLLEFNNEDGPGLTEVSGADRVLEQLGAK